MIASRRMATGRRGVTLLEVLVAILIAGVGLLALLTLFPLRATSMAQALKDDRGGQLAAIGDELLKVRDEIVASSRAALADLLQADPSRAEAHCQAFAIHDAQLTALILKLDQVQLNLQDEQDRRLAERAARELTKWRKTVRDVKDSFRILAEWERQQANP